MTQKDIDNASGVYTFEDIELNYDVGNNTSYTAEQAKLRMGKNEKDEYFTGNYDQKLNDKFKKCSYDDFYFTGTLHLQQGNATEGSAFIAPGDYIIQNNTFVKCLEGKKYGLKGFRGYFKRLPSSTSPAKGNIGICLVDRNGNQKDTLGSDTSSGGSADGDGTVWGDAKPYNPWTAWD